ncbi:MAG: right-handed parallel beta-helix repeat-containing protein, partial [Candidatus Dormibacteria bacterium]
VKDTTNFGRAFQPGTGLGIVTNPFLGFDRPRMVSLNANQIIGNTVINNGSAGISTVSNVKGVVRSNLAAHNGFQSPFGGAFPGNGIGVTYAHNATPNTNELVENNQVYGNGRDGIEVVASGNQILNNIGNGNGAGAFGGFDFRDFDSDPVTFQPSCSTNTWSGNQWGSGGFFPQCVSNGGSPLPGTTAQAMPMGPPEPDGLGDPPPRISPS